MRVFLSELNDYKRLILLIEFKFLNQEYSRLMDNFNIKLHATHSQVQMRMAEIRFDLRHTIRQVKVS